MKIFNNLPKLSSEDTANSIVTYESMDNANATSWTDVDVIKSGEKHHSLFKKISTMFKNIRYLFKTLGTTDISTIGDGTVTGGLSKINNDLNKLVKVDTFTTTTTIASGESQTPSVFITVPSGYVIIGFDYSIGLGHVIASGIKEQRDVIGYNNNTRLVFNIVNNHNTSLSPTITVNVIFIKKEFII